MLVQFIDFQDSFSFNVVQELSHIGLDCKVFTWPNLPPFNPHQLLVLGPGPGHPSEYPEAIELLGLHLKSGGKVFGVCLGHQLIWSYFGAEISIAPNPCHGQQVEIPIDPIWQSWFSLESPIRVQRYNSLAVTHVPEIKGAHLLMQGNELMAAFSSNIISYQFHPESVGTMCRSHFFQPILRVLI